MVGTPSPETLRNLLGIWFQLGSAHHHAQDGASPGPGQDPCTGGICGMRPARHTGPASSACPHVPTGCVPRKRVPVGSALKAQKQMESSWSRGLLGLKIPQRTPACPGLGSSHPGPWNDPSPTSTASSIPVSGWRAAGGWWDRTRWPAACGTAGLWAAARGALVRIPAVPRQEGSLTLAVCPWAPPAWAEGQDEPGEGEVWGGGGEAHARPA